MVADSHLVQGPSQSASLIPVTITAAAECPSFQMPMKPDNTTASTFDDGEKKPKESLGKSMTKPGNEPKHPWSASSLENTNSSCSSANKHHPMGKAALSQVCHMSHCPNANENRFLWARTSVLTDEGSHFGHVSPGLPAAK